MNRIADTIAALESATGHKLLAKAPRYMFGGAPVRLSEYIRINAETLSIGDVARVLALQRGEVLHFGGGTAPFFKLSRVL